MFKKFSQSLLKFSDRLFLSVPVTILLILAICIICLLGATDVLPKVFTTQWFLLCLAYVGFAMLYCSVRRLPRLIHLYQSGPGSRACERGQAISAFDGFIPSDARPEFLKGLDHFFKRRGYQKRILSVHNEKPLCFYEKARIGILGPQIIHLGLAVLLVAGLLTAWGGDFYDITIREGESLPLKGTSAILTLEKFDILPSHTQEMADDYASRLRVNQPHKPVKWYTLKVNDPQRIEGRRLYQNRYSYDIERLDLAVLDPKGEKVQRNIALQIGERVAIPELNMAVEVNDFIPDFAIDAQGKVAGRSQAFRNPAAKLLVYMPGGAKNPFEQEWVFKNFIVPHPGKESGLPWRFMITRVKITNTSGIKIADNPGEYLTCFGLCILVLGAILSCFQFYRCMAVQLQDAGSGKVNIKISALKAKNMFEFEREIKDIEHALKTMPGWCV